MKEDLIWIWGVHPVLEAINSGRARSVLISPEKRRSPGVMDVLEAAVRRNVSVGEASSRALEDISSGAKTQGMAARAALPRLHEVPELLTLLRQSAARPFVLVLDQVQDPHNYGALLRTADAAGVQAVMVPRRRSAPLSGTVAKASAGASSYVPVLQVSNLSAGLRTLREAGLWAVGLHGEASMSLYEVDLTEPVALVVGNEGEGLRRLTRQHCDFVVSLPMRGTVSSLNASVAGGIAMYEAVRQRKA